MCKMKVTIHSLDQKMIGQHYGSKSSNSSVKPGYLHTPGFSWAELRLGNNTLRDLLRVSG